MKIWTMHASGKNAKQLTKGTDPDADPRFSPDGKRILYTTLRGGFPEIWLMNRDGSEAKFVTKGSQGSWSPDGKSIVFIQDNQTFVRDLASGQGKTRHAEGLGALRRAGVQSRRQALRRRQPAPGQHRHLHPRAWTARRIRQLKAEEACCTPHWSKDGKKILCQTVQGHIHQVGVDGKNWEQLTFGADVQHDARYSPDGTMILFCRAPAPEGPWQICVKRLDGDEDEFVTDHQGRVELAAGLACGGVDRFAVGRSGVFVIAPFRGLARAAGVGPPLEGG